jgi:DNA-binding transcriptional MerR regulator
MRQEPSVSVDGKSHSTTGRDIMPYEQEPITARQVRELREAHGLSMREAKQILQDDWDKAHLEWLLTEATLEEKVNYLLQRQLAAVEKRIESRYPPLRTPDESGPKFG